MPSDQDIQNANPWIELRRYTGARIVIGHTGISQPTQAQLEFQLAHAQARDAVHHTLDTQQLAAAINAAFSAYDLRCVTLQSAAADRIIYLQRPDLGRKLDEESRNILDDLRSRRAPAASPYDIAFVIADGLSARAVEQHAIPFLQTLMTAIAPEKWTIAPIAIVRQGRVAVGDETAELLGAQIVIVLIGERPGLSSPDSMGLYLTWSPHAGLTDESRNCISNIRPAGLTYGEAAYKAHYLLSEAKRRNLSGVELKDETDGGLGQLPMTNNFLLIETNS